MTSFKDSKGAEWEIALPFGAVKRIKTASSDKFDLLNTKLAETVYSDFAEFWELLWYIVEPQAKAKGVTAEQFGELMAPACLLDARDQFIREWLDFFRTLQLLPQTKALEVMQSQLQAATQQLVDRIDKELPALTAKGTEKINRTLDSEFGKLLASLESTPEA